MSRSATVLDTPVPRPAPRLRADVLPRVLVLQVGARRDYSMPIVIEQAGMLEAFYTDMCAGRGLGRLAAALSRVIPADTVKVVADRRLPDAVLAKTRTFDAAALEHAVREKFARSAEGAFREALRYSAAFGRHLSAAGARGATHILSCFGEGDAFLAEARRAGATIVTDMIIALSSDRIVLEEHRTFRDWGQRPLDRQAVMGPQFRPAGMILENTDLFICPSQFVRDDLIDNWGVKADATRLVPYAVAQHWFHIHPEPEHGRVLFAGTAELRKGIHYMAMAADKLISKRRRYAFRVAGDVAPEVKRQPLCKSLTFLGRVPGSRMREEFAKADVMVLPTLAEGSASVTYEAMAAGIPVVTTRAAGSAVRHGVDGLIVAERDADAVADAIEKIVEDRGLRAAMSDSARERAREFTFENYGSRLIDAIITPAG